MSSGGEASNDGEQDQPWPEQGDRTDRGTPNEQTSSTREQPSDAGPDSQSEPAYDQPSAATSDSATGVLTRPDGQAALTTVVTTFALVGFGTGLGFLVGDTALGETMTALTMLTYLGGPFLAAVVGLRGVTAVGDTDREAYVLSFVSTAVGAFVMVLLAAAFASSVIAFFQFGDFITAGVMMAIPTGIVTVGVVWATE